MMRTSLVMYGRPSFIRHALSALLLFIAAIVLVPVGGCLYPDRHPPTCASGAKDGDESDVDCGGKCDKCTGGGTCNSGDDCTSGTCDGTCAPADGEPTITSFKANHNHAPLGTVIELTAEFSGGTAEIDQNVGAVESGVAVKSPPLGGPTLFTLTVTSESGISSSRRVKVDIGTLPTITSFKAEKPAIRPGQSTNLTAVFEGGKGTIDNNIGEVTSGKAVSTGAVNENKHYVLTVTDESGEKVTAEADVEAAITPVITSFGPPTNVVSRFKGADLKAVFKGGKGTVDKGVGAIESGVVKVTPEVPIAGETWTLTVTNGLGESTSKTVTVTTKKEIFVADYGQDVLVFDIDDHDDAEPKRILLTDTSIVGILGLWIDNGEIYVANESGTPSITVYALDAGGRPPYSDNVVYDKPKRKITFGAEGVDGPYIFMVAGDELFVADKTSTIKVWNKSDNGKVPPKRTISGALTGLDNALSVYVDGGELYVANYASAGDTASITVYPQTASGNVKPKRTIPAVQPTGLLVIGNELFVTNKIGEITVYNKTTGAQLRKIAGTATGLNELYQCSAANNQLFCADYSTDKLVVFPTNASGNVAPDHVIKGDHTYMSSTSCVTVF